MVAIPPMNLSNQDNVLSSFELVLKKSHEFGDRRVNPSKKIRTLHQSVKSLDFSFLVGSSKFNSCRVTLLLSFTTTPTLNLLLYFFTDKKTTQ